MASSTQLIETLSALDFETFENAAERSKVADSLLGALRRLQTSWDVVADHGWAGPAVTANIKTLIDAGLWSKWEAAGGKPSHVSELAKISGIEEPLLVRLLRQLAGEKLLGIVDQDTFAMTRFTKSLATEQYASIYNYIFHTNIPIFANFPKFAAKRGYTNPTDLATCNFADWYGPGETVFSYYTANPGYGKDFADTMQVYSGTKLAWPLLYPSSNVLDGAKPDRALVVDVGGSTGHDLQKFYELNKSVPDGSLVLQDLPEIAQGAKIQSPIVAQGHDFFQPQPVKGARAYYMHCILHDWPDSESIKILKNLAAAMEKGYSRILIHEIVVKLDNVSRHETYSDLTMLFCLSAIERTEVMWKNLVEQAGLVVTKVWTTPESIESIIECELA